MHDLRFAVMGNPIAHSRSPEIYQSFARQFGIVLTYEKICVDESLFEEQVGDFFKEGGKGLNITAPFKQRAFSMSDEVSDRCLQAQAANTLWVREGRLCADNTDGVGLLRDITNHVGLSDKRVVVFGAGGAVRGILSSLLAANPAKITVANRTLSTALQLQAAFPTITGCSFTELQGEFDVVIHATSADFDKQPVSWPLEIMASKPFCYDLKYDVFLATPFVAWARALGCEAVDGYGMLLEQAAEAFYLWHGVRPAVLKDQAD